MSETSITPALTPEEWESGELDNAMLDDHDPARLFVYAAGYTHARNAKDRHALAALCLYEQPFGFTQEEVTRLREEADSAESWYPGGPGSHDWLRALAAKIAALLPPAE